MNLTEILKANGIDDVPTKLREAVEKLLNE